MRSVRVSVESENGWTDALINQQNVCVARLFEALHCENIVRPQLVSLSTHRDAIAYPTIGWYLVLFIIRSFGLRRSCRSSSTLISFASYAHSFIPAI